MCCTTKKNGYGFGRSDQPGRDRKIGHTELNAFIKAGWDETEIIGPGSSWRTFKSFVTGSEYKYSPISALYVFERPQDIGLQKARDTIHERNHLRLWLSPVRYQGEFVWIGAISRDIGVFFTTRAWNLTTHAIDPEVDEARDYLGEDLATAQALSKLGRVSGVGEVMREAPKKNLLGSPLVDGWPSCHSVAVRTTGADRRSRNLEPERYDTQIKGQPHSDISFAWRPPGRSASDARRRSGKSVSISGNRRSGPWLRSAGENPMPRNVRHGAG